MLGRAVFVTEDDAVLVDMGFHFRENESRVRILQVADDEIFFWSERRVHAYSVARWL